MTTSGVALRDAGVADEAFLAEMLACAADWRSTTPRPVDAVLAEPGLAHYVEGWPRPGDFGVIAEDGTRPVGAAWWRFFEPHDPGYGYVDAATPEVAIAVVADHRGRGVGDALLRALVAAAAGAGIARLSLSVEMDNPARRLYERLGFVTVGVVDGSATMVLDVAESEVPG